MDKNYKFTWMSFVLLVTATTCYSQDNNIQNSSSNNNSKNCMEKVELVEETKYDTKIKCHHTYRDNCYRTYETRYVPSLETECSDDYKKSCSIEYQQQARDISVQVCHQPLTRNCEVGGPIICTTEHETICETEISSHNVIEDIPECETVFETRCMDDPQNEGEEICGEIPRQVCQLKQEEHVKAKPISKCKRVRTEVCGPEECPLVMGEEICQDIQRTVLDNVPVEVCELQPQQVCKQVSKLIPRLTPVNRCIQVPKEICVKMRVNPRQVRRPVVKLWCSDEKMPR